MWLWFHCIPKEEQCINFGITDSSTQLLGLERSDLSFVIFNLKSSPFVSMRFLAYLPPNFLLYLCKLQFISYKFIPMAFTHSVIPVCSCHEQLKILLIVFIFQCVLYFLIMLSKSSCYIILCRFFVGV